MTGSSVMKIIAYSTHYTLSISFLGLQTTENKEPLPHHTHTKRTGKEDL